MSLTGDYLSAKDALRAGLVTEVVAHDDLLPTARGVAASIVGNNAKAVRALLESYHRIDEQQTSAGLWIEAVSATRWKSVATVDESPPTARPVLERDGPRCTDMNEAHEHCGSDEWRQMMRDVILPWAMGEIDLGDDVLEVGPGYGARTDVLSRVRARAHLGRDRRRTRGDAHRALRRRADRRDRAGRRHRARLRRRSLHRCGLLHDAAPRPHRRAAGPAVRRGRPGAAAGGGAGGQRQPRPATSSRAHHDDDTYNPVDPGVAAGPAGRRGSPTSTCAPTRYGWAVVARTA